MAIWSRLTGAIAGLGIGGAAATAFEPAFEVPRQVAWEGEPNRVLDLGTLAHLIAQGLLEEGAAVNEAARNGYNGNRLRALVQVQLKAPDVAEALELWRRGRISEAQVDHALAKSQLEAQYHEAVKELEFARLDPAVIATAVQRGLLPNSGILPVGPPAEVGRVTPMPMVALDPFEEAFATGVNPDRLKVEARIVGLPPGPGELLQLLNRDKIDPADFYRGIAEGNTRNEWAPFLLELRHAVLSAAEYANLHLRGWIDVPAMDAGGALTGHSPAQMDLLFKGHGRPATAHQVFVGLRRGGVYDGPLTGIDPAFVTAVRQSDIRPEWTNLLWAQRYTYPTAFVLRALTQAGDLTQPESERILLFEGWEPRLATQVSTKWAAGGGAATKELTKAELLAEFEGYYIDEAEFRSRLGALGYPATVQDLEVELGNARRVKAERDRVLTATFKHYTKHEITREDASSRLDTLRIPAEARDNILAVWDVEAIVNPAKLTRSEIKRAYKANRLTRDDALAQLEALGYSETDAIAYLDS